VFPAPLMSTIGELGTFLAREGAAATASTPAGVDDATTAQEQVAAPAPNGALKPGDTTPAH
jgi:hypothetical protein